MTEGPIYFKPFLDLDFPPAVSMVALGIRHDAPGNPLQAHALPTGIHLRWSVSPYTGFPWYGFYLLRRLHVDGCTPAMKPLPAFNSLFQPGKPPDLSRLLDPDVVAQLAAHAQDGEASDQQLQERLRSLLDRSHHCDTVELRRILAAMAHRWSRERSAFRAADVLLARALITVLNCSCTCDGDCRDDESNGHSSRRRSRGHGDSDSDSEHGGPGHGAGGDGGDSTGSWPHWGGAGQPDCKVWGGGWIPVPGFPAPMGLPVRHANYPATGGKATDLAFAVQLANQRIKYGSPSPLVAALSTAKKPIVAPTGELIDQGPSLHDLLVDLVKGGTGSYMASVMVPTAEGVAAGPDVDEAPDLEAASLLDWLQMASLHPGFAQMIGTMWADTSASLVTGQGYDYALVADMKRGFASPQDVAAWLNSGAQDPDGVWWCSVSDVKVDKGPPLPRPSGVRAYFLPGATMDVASAPNLVQQVVGRVGLRWELPIEMPLPSSTSDDPEKPEVVSPLVLHHVWRADLGKPGEATPGASPAPHDYHALPVGAPIPRIAAESPDAAQYPPPIHWPPLQMHALDTVESEGWYAYRVSSMDLFGRCSPLSEPAAWMSWKDSQGEVPDPKPWYFGSNVPDVIHQWAVRALDKTPPPPPSALEAQLIDPKDPFAVTSPYVAALVSESVSGDSKVAAKAKSALAELFLTEGTRHQFQQLAAAQPGGAVFRVRWKWRYLQTRQAPATTEFRLYFESGRFNTWVGKVLDAWTDTYDPHRTIVSTDIQHVAGFPGKPPETWLRVGSQAFLIKEILLDAAGNLQFVVQNNDTELAQKKGQPDFAAKPGKRGACSVALKQPVPPSAKGAYRDSGLTENWEHRVAVVPFHDPKACRVEFEELTDENGVVVSGIGATWAGQWCKLDVGEMDRLGTVRPGVHLIQLAPPPKSGEVAAFALDPAHCHVILAVSLEEQKVLIDAVPKLKSDKAAWRIGAPVRVYEQFLAADNLLHAPDHLVSMAWGQIGVSAADNCLHSEDAKDWGGGRRKGNEGRVAGPVGTFRVCRDVPPAPQLVDAAGYQPPGKIRASRADANGNSYFTFRWSKPQEGYRIHVYRALDEALFVQDLKNRSADDAAVKGAVVVWVANLPQAVQANVQASFDGLDCLVKALVSSLGTPAEGESRAKALKCYRKFDDDCLWVLANLPKMDAAYVQVTEVPLDGAKHPDKAGPDDKDGVVLADSGVCSWVDTLPGRQENRFAYRGRFVDAAGNVGGWCGATRAVHVPRTRLPAVPIIASATPGNPLDPKSPQAQVVSITWQFIDDSDAVAVYRAACAEDAQSLATMECRHDLVQKVLLASSATSTVVDSAKPGLNWYYRLVAVHTESGLRSQPTQAVVLRALES